MAMCFFPSAKKRATAEVDEFVRAKDRLPTHDDRGEFPYIHALALELFRWGMFSPLSIPHCALEDVMYEGRVIPAGTTIVTNLWAMSRDDEVYPYPEEFLPERFLGEERQLDPREFAFGFGRRY